MGHYLLFIYLVFEELYENLMGWLMLYFMGLIFLYLKCD